jgi:UDP-glucose 4-epimerase
LKNEKIFITGGAGFIGKALIKKYHKDSDITVFSRDENKHYYLNKQYPEIKCIIGDIRNKDLLCKSMKGHTIGLFTASMKQIDAVNYNPEEALKVIIKGALNSRYSAQENGLKAACFISSDKSRSATTIYGAMKFVAGECFIWDADQFDTRLSSAIHGNVLNSTGSVIPLIWDAIKNKYEMQLYSEEMTRFSITVDTVVNTIDKALEVTGFNVIPRANSIRIKDLFTIYAEEFGLKYKVTNPRPGEKIHEIQISSEEMFRTTNLGSSTHYFMHPKNIYNEVNLPNNGYSSKDHCMTKSELYDMLSTVNFFRKDTI